MKMLMKTEWKIKMQIKIKIKTKNTKQNVNDDRKTQMQIQIEIKVAEPPRIPYTRDGVSVNRPFCMAVITSSTFDKLENSSFLKDYVNTELKEHVYGKYFNL